jgi:glutamate-1-semialdehyde 2,1-aminomutase
MLIIVCFGKVIGGGLPVGAFAARYGDNGLFNPLGANQAGTLSGNPWLLLDWQRHKH